MASYAPACMPHNESSTKGPIANPSYPDQQSTLIENGSHKKAINMCGILQVTIHRARDIHNICIYGNQDVYAKFIVTQIECQDAVYTTQTVKSGGQNPVFNQIVEIPVSGGWHAVLRCELWMMSCARNYLEDQLLGFALVPLNNLYGKEDRQTQEYCLTSTDLFYTPAGMVQLSLSFIDHTNIEISKEMHSESDKQMPDGGDKMFPQGSHLARSPRVDACEAEVVMEYQQENLRKIEFVDLDAVSEDQHLVSMYYKMAETEAYNEATTDLPTQEHRQNSLGDDRVKAKNGEIDVEPDDKNIYGATQMVLQSGMANVNDGMVWSPSAGKGTEPNGLSINKNVSNSPCDSASSAMNHVPSPTMELVSSSSSSSMETQPTTTSSSCIGDSNQSLLPFEVHEKSEDASLSTRKVVLSESSPFTSSTPLVSISLEPEVSINQEHFVDLYLKSMQQFTEKLADMKFSFDVDAQEPSASLQDIPPEKVSGGKKEGPKLYYGSRAFF